MAKCPSESSWTNLSGDQQLERHQRDARTKREEIRSALRSGAVIWRRSGRGHHGRPPEPSRSPRHAGQARRSAAIEPSHHVRDNNEKPSLTKTRLPLHTTCVFFYNGVPATNGTRPNRFAAVVAGPNLFRWMSRPDVGRVSIGPIRWFGCTRVPGNFTNFARSARNRPRALSQTGIPTRHDQVACRKARERSRVVVQPGAVMKTR
jgi:hypothetical protein